MGSIDVNFPEGLRVLIVHNSTIYLNLMKDLLEKCKYNVTATNQLRKALRMLKENRNNFDIMIANDQMAEMDGITLLQLVNLKMNLPVIMLSTYNDTKIVMQWIKNGACDCLVKPVGIQEFQNIWKHVFLRNNCIHQRLPDHPTGRNTLPDGPTINTSQCMVNKGKGIGERNEDDKNKDDKLGEGDHESNEGITIQKKPRFHWSDELHQKFIDIVNQLGPNKAFPKKIAELMNVEGVTRDKVASHLQKYKLYLQKVDSRNNQEEKRLYALEPEVHTGSLGGGYGVYRSLTGKRMFGELNTASNISLEGLSSFSMVQATQLPNSFNNFGRFNSPNLLENQNNSLFPDVPETFLFKPPPTSIMLNENQPLSGIKYGNQSSSLLPCSSTLGSSGMSYTDNFPNWGTPQTNSFLQNEISTDDFSNVISSTIASIHSFPHDNFCGISSFNGSVHNLDSVSLPNDSFDNTGHENIWHNQCPDYVLNSFNISTTTVSTITTTTSPIVDRNIEKQNNNHLIGASLFTYLEGSSSNNEVPKLNNEADLTYDGHTLLDEPKLLCGSGQSSFGYLEDIVKERLK